MQKNQFPFVSMIDAAEMMKKANIPGHTRQNIHARVKRGTFPVKLAENGPPHSAWFARKDVEAYIQSQLKTSND